MNGGNNYMNGGANMNGGRNFQQNNSLNGPESRICHNCDDRGHVQRYCRFYPRAMGPNGRYGPKILIEYNSNSSQDARQMAPQINGARIQNGALPQNNNVTPNMSQGN